MGPARAWRFRGHSFDSSRDCCCRLSCFCCRWFLDCRGSSGPRQRSALRWPVTDGWRSPCRARISGGRSRGVAAALFLAVVLQAPIFISALRMAPGPFPPVFFHVDTPYSLEKVHEPDEDARLSARVTEQRRRPATVPLRGARAGRAPFADVRSGRPPRTVSDRAAPPGRGQHCGCLPGGAIARTSGGVLHRRAAPAAPRAIALVWVLGRGGPAPRESVVRGFVGTARHADCQLRGLGRGFDRRP